MRKLGLALLLLACLGAPAQAQPSGPPNAIPCNQVTTGTGAVQIATAVANKIIVVCGWAIESTAAAGAWVLSYGTGAVCATSPTDISPNMTALPAGATEAIHTVFANSQLPAAANLCVRVDTTVSWAVYWAQF